MEAEKEAKLKSQFKKVYLDTLKHEEDIERWIKAGKRKKGDIRRSIQRLETKYQTLCDLKRKLGKNRVKGIQIVLNKEINLRMIREKIDELYDLSGIKPKKEADEKDGIKIELVSDIPGNEDLIFDREIIENDKIGLFGYISEKFNKIKNKIKEYRKQKKKNKKPGKIRKLTAIVVAGAIALFSGTTVGEPNGSVKENNNGNAYVDTTRDNNNSFKESIYVEAMQENETRSIEQEPTEIETEKTRPTQIEEKIEETTTQNELEENDFEDDIFVVKAGTKYTEVSDGSGNIGYFSNDNRVSVYCRAAIKTDEYGNRSIIATKAKQTWKDFATENNIDYDEFKEYLENNPNVQEMVALDSEDGKREYGWVSIDKLEKVEEIER